MNSYFIRQNLRSECKLLAYKTSLKDSTCWAPYRGWQRYHLLWPNFIVLPLRFRFFSLELSSCLLTCLLCRFTLPHLEAKYKGGDYR